MATSNFSVAPDNTTDATFRVWCLALHTALSAILTAVTQTGEANFTTLVRPAGVNTKAGFRIYRFNDTHQSTHPMFLRVDFGTGSTNTFPSIWLQVGQSVDGGGNLAVPATGTIMASTQCSVNKAGSATAYDCFVSGENGRITVCLWPLFHTATERPVTFNIERVKDATGAEIDEAIGVDSFSYPIMFSLILTKNGRNFSCFYSSGVYFGLPYRQIWTSATYGLKLAVFAPLHYSQIAVYNGLTGVFIYSINDIDGNDLIAISVYGTNHSYYPTGRGSGLTDASGTTTQKTLVRND